MRARRLWTGLLCAGFLCATSAQGQTVRDEGFPSKPVSSEAFPDAFGGENCVAVLFPGEFEERCIEDNEANAPDPFGGRGSSSPFDAADPLWNAPPRLECPSAVFLEEMETASIDCRAWDASGQEASDEAIDYAWERVGGAARDYMEHPLLTPQDSHQPLLIAPSSPFYDTLESFLAEETTKKYRYRLRATSRATGLSSFAEVDVFVLLNRPSVHCPLEVEVEEGATVALSCEGADPLSFRMDEEAGSSVSWEWEGLWNASTSPLSETDLSAPFFTAPLGAAGETYHYVASMTTTSSGVPRTARRKVSVTVVEGENAELDTAHNPPPTITCPEYELYPTANNFLIKCKVKNEPAGAKYKWTHRSGSSYHDHMRFLKSTELETLTPEFYMHKHGYNDTKYGDIRYEYTLTLSAPRIEDVTEDVTVTALKMPDLMDCTVDYEVDLGGTVRLNCKPTGMATGKRKPDWILGQSGETPYTTRETDRLPKKWRDQVVSPEWNPLFRAPKSLPGNPRKATYKYYLCVQFYDQPSGHPQKNIRTYDFIIESEHLTVTVVDNRPDIKVTCDPVKPVYGGGDDLTLQCKAENAPAGAAYSYEWEARGATTNLNRFIKGKKKPTPTFDVPDAPVSAKETYEYKLKVSAPGARPGETDVTVEVLPHPKVVVQCPVDPYSAYEGSGEMDLGCKVSGVDEPGAKNTYVWTALGSAKMDMLVSGTDGPTPTFEAPGNVDQDETYEYKLTVSTKGPWGTEKGEGKVAVKVLNKRDIVVDCNDPDPVYEGSKNHIQLNCKATGAPGIAAYTYVWTALGSAKMDMLVAGTDGPTPMFDVPDEVDQEETYEYAVTVSAANADDGEGKVTVTVLNKPQIQVACATPDPVREGSKDIMLSCEATGAPEGSPYAYSWKAKEAPADASLLTATNIPSPMFRVPATVPKTTTYKYQLTASAANAENGMADVTVTVLDAGAIAVSCSGNPYSAYEGSPDIMLSCEATGAPPGTKYDYAWTAMGSTPDLGMLQGADGPKPTFSVPVSVDADETYEYRLTAKAETMQDGVTDVTVNVLKRPVISVQCADPDPVYEGDDDFDLDCKASGLSGSAAYTYAWTARDAMTDMSLLSDAGDPTPTFSVPDEVDQDEKHEYRLTVSAENAVSATEDVVVTVRKMGTIAVACPDSPYSAYEGADDITLDCSASGAPDGSEYAYSWTAPSAPSDMSLLSGANDRKPTFSVPDDVPQTTTYEYRLTVSAENAKPATAEVVVTVRKSGAIVVACAPPASVYEGSPDILFDCSAEGAHRGSEYAHAWEPWGTTSDTDLLSATDIPSPTFSVPAEVDKNETYEYKLTVSAENAESATAEVMVTVLNKPAIVVACTDPAPVYEGAPDIALNCSAPGAPADASYVWEARGTTADADRLSATDILSPTFVVPDEVDRDETYGYRLTVSAENMEDGVADVTVRVLNAGAIVVACADIAPVYEGSPDVALDCSATGAPEGSSYAYAWEARGATADLGMLSAADISSPAFMVPAEVDQDETYEYRLTVSAENAEPASADVTVTVLNAGAIVVSCAGNPYSTHEGAEDIAFDCSATGAPEGSSYAYAWQARGATADTDLLVAGSDGPTPTFAVPDAVDQNETYEYRLTVSAENAEPASADVTVTVLDRPAAVVVAQQALAEPTGLGLAVDASLLRFGTQAANTQVALDPLTDRITNSLSGPYNATYHAGRMTLALGDADAEAAFSIELLSPATLRLVGDADAPPLALAPTWSYAASCEQKASTAIRGLRMETTLSETDDCRMLLFGGYLDFADARPGRYEGAINVVLRSGVAEETHSVPVEARVAPAYRMITIGPGGARIDAATGMPSGLTQEQNLSVYPDLAFLTDAVPSGAFALSNPSLVPLEISVTARFGYAEATEDGREVVVEDKAASRLGDLSEWVDMYPRTLMLEPGEEGVVRYAVKAAARSTLTAAGYAAFFELTSSPRQYVRADHMPEDVSKTARVTLRAPAAYAPGENPARLSAELLSLSQGASPSATFLVETEGRPFAGDVVAYDAGGRELGRGRALVYTRSRVRMTLARTPEQGEAALLRFAPLHSGRAPEPVEIRWDAPGSDLREIGAAMDAKSPSLGVAPAPAGKN